MKTELFLFISERQYNSNNSIFEIFRLFFAQNSEIRSVIVEWGKEMKINEKEKEKHESYIKKKNTKNTYILSIHEDETNPQRIVFS